MASRVPKPTYGLALVAPVMQAVAFVTEKFFTSTEWWSGWTQTWPMGTIWVGTIAFLAGLLIQDGYNNNSWIWANWKHFTRKFEVVGLYVKHAVSDPKRLEVNVRIKFVRRIRSANLALRVHSCTGMQQAPHIHTIKVETLSDVMKDEQRTIKVATLIVPYPGYTPFHSIWGNAPLSTDATAPSLVGGSKNVVYLELTGPWMMGQRHKFFVVNLDYAAPQAMPAIYAQDEDDDFFKIS